MWQQKTSNGPSAGHQASGWRAHFGLPIAVGLLPAVALGLSWLPADRLLERAYGGPMQRVQTAWAPVAQAPEIKLVGLPTAKTGRKALAKGDRLVIDGRSGTKEAIEIVGIEDMDGAGLGLDGMTLQIVTGRADGGAPADVVRFLFVVEKPEAAKKADHAL